MKTLKIVLTILFLTAANYANAETVSALSDSTEELVQNDKKLFKTFEKSIVFGLNSDVQGVLESTLHNAISYKVKYPEFNSQKVLQAVSTVALDGENHSLRFKAYLVLAYYQNQDDFESPETLMSMIDHGNQNEIFYYLQDTLQSDQFTAKN